MNITPMDKINTLNELSKIKSGDDESIGGSNGDVAGLQPFKEVFDEALNTYKDSEDQVSQDIYDLSVGNTDDLHNLMINMNKAEMSLDMFIQLRNKALDAYTELMGLSM